MQSRKALKKLIQIISTDEYLSFKELRQYVRNGHVSMLKEIIHDGTSDINKANMIEHSMKRTDAVFKLLGRLGKKTKKKRRPVAP